jgi:hypothetical protein
MGQGSLINRRWTHLAPASINGQEASKKIIASKNYLRRRAAENHQLTEASVLE